MDTPPPFPEKVIVDVERGLRRRGFHVINEETLNQLFAGAAFTVSSKLRLMDEFASFCGCAMESNGPLTLAILRPVPEAVHRPYRQTGRVNSPDGQGLQGADHRDSQNPLLIHATITEVE